MEKQQLITELTNFFSNDVSVDLYFVFKSNGYHIQYKADPDDDLREELIEEFSEELKRYSDLDNPYPLTNIYDDNENEEYHLYFDDLDNNRVAKEVFEFDKANALPYTKEIGELSKIWGFLIELSDGNKTITVYKRNQPTNSITTKKYINFFTGTDNKFKLLNQNAIYISKSIDLFKINSTLFINSKTVYEFQFGFIAELQNKAEESYLELTTNEGFDFADELANKIIKLQKGELKKLTNAVKNNPILQTKNFNAIIRQSKAYANHKFEKDENGNIKIHSQKELKILISILNRDYNVNDATKEKFLTKNKKLLK
jgi:hypothetical protein